MTVARLLATSALPLLSSIFALPAYAQTAETQPTDAAAPAAPEEVDSTAIIVTGSRIARPNLSAAVPITSVGGTEITETGNVALGDLLNDLPALRNTFSQANSTAFIGTAGVNFLDLRGLGTARTLVLQNGRRHVSATPGIARVDVNTIPTDLVERIDIVTGGTSAIYGSDAIAGVVNFVLKRDFDGLTARVQTGISSRGDRPSYTGVLTAGKNFAEGRGNIAISAEYNRAESLDVLDRSEFTGSFRGRDQFNLIENPAGETALGGDGIFDRNFLRNVRSLGLFEGGAFIASSATGVGATSACVTGIAAACIPTGAVGGSPRVFYFNPDGTLGEANYGVDLRGPTNNGTGNTIGGNGSTLRRYGQLQPFVERYGVNLLAHFDVADAFRPFVEAKYIRYDIRQESSPTFQQGGTQGTGTAAAQLGFPANSTGVPIQFDNAFLNPAAANQIRSLLPAGSVAFRLQRNNIDLGSRQETGFRETYRIVAGIEGTFNDDWRYEISGNYGNFRQDLLSLNNRIQQRFRLAVDAVRNPAVGGVAGVAAGAPVCRSQIAGTVTATPANAADAAALAGDIAACQPLNLFGEGAPSSAAITYINANTLSVQKQEQKVVSGFLSGDLSQLFELQGGPIGFAIGAEYREEDGFRDYGDLVTSGRTFLTAISRFRPPQTFEVKEAFGEINIPLFKERPFFHELSIQGALRVADYKGATGTVLAWNAGGTWAPIRDIRIRGNYAVAVRAPTQFDLFAELGQNFATINDPCDVNNITNGTATRAANCAAAGIPANFVNSPARGANTSISNGGNALLQEERSRSITIGAVLQPRFVPGVTITADYYDIEVTDVIGSPSAQQIVNNCYDSATINNAFCAVVNRDPTTKFFSTVGPQFAVVQGPINFAKSKTRGVDVDFSYRGQIEGVGQLTTSLVGTYVLQRDDFPFIDERNRPDQILFEVGDPELQFNFSASLKTGPFTLGYQGRYIGKQAISLAIEDIRQVGTRPPVNIDYADVEFFDAVTYHDFRVGLEVDKRFNFYAGIDNAFDRLPQYGILGNGSTYSADAIFDNIGRYFYAGAIVKF